MDIFERILEGEIAPRMMFNGHEVLCWSLNNYLGLANHPEVRKVDAEAAARWGLAYPMGSRMMSGQTSLHERLERELAEFEQKEDAFLFNFGYQGIVSTIDALVNRHDVIVYDSEAHACLIDGCRLQTGGGVLLITEGVYGMTGALGILDQIVALKKKYQFRILIDDAHGFGVMGPHGRGTSEHFGVMDGIDLYIGAYAKSMAIIGGFVAGPKSIINYLRYNLRSQIYAKSLPMPIVEGCLKRLEIIRGPEGDRLREKLWTVTRALQNGFRERGFDIGLAQACVTPVFIHGTVPQATNMLVDLRENYNLFCSVVVYPVVPKPRPRRNSMPENMTETISRTGP